METVNQMVDVLCQRLSPGLVGQARSQATGVRRRRTTNERADDVDPAPGGDDRLDQLDDSDPEMQQREKEVKRDSSAGIDEIDKALPTESDLREQWQVEHGGSVAERSVMQADTPTTNGTKLLPGLSGGRLAETGPEGQPVPASDPPPDNCPLPETVHCGGDSLIVSEGPTMRALDAVAAGNLPNEEPVHHSNDRRSPGPMAEASFGNQPEKCTVCQDPNASGGRQSISSTAAGVPLDTSRHSWHVENETQTNLTTDDVELSAIFTSNTRSLCTSYLNLGGGAKTGRKQSYSIGRIHGTSRGAHCYGGGALQKERLRLRYGILLAYGSYFGYSEQLLPASAATPRPGRRRVEMVRSRERFTPLRPDQIDGDFPMADGSFYPFAALTQQMPLQLRAVSSPSLSEAPVETAVPHAAGNDDDGHRQHVTSSAVRPPAQHPQPNGTQPKTAKAPSNSTTSSHHHPPAQVSESVLQKFRKTFSHFKTSKTTASPVNGAGVSLELQTSAATMSVDDKLQQQSTTTQQQQQQQTHHHHRFGPLIWRSSKERRKTKSHRRDKCNSGDSGIQVELDNDADQQLLLQHLHPLEHHPETNRNGVRCLEVSSHCGGPVRRANSAKVSTNSGTSSISSSALRHKLSLKGKDKENIGNGGPRLSGKSLSQPSGLDCIVGTGGTTEECCETGDGGRRRRRQHGRTATTIPTELDLSDSESISSHPDEDEAVDARSEEDLLEPVFAEVLFSFRPGGPQELALEKGALMEVLKREPGPWWWGRMKSDAVLARPNGEEHNGGSGKLADCGWFPKDYVKLLPRYGKPKQIIVINNSDPEDPKQPCGDGDDGESSASTLIEGGTLMSCDSRLQGQMSTATTHSEADPETPDGTIPSHNLTKENIIKELLETEINYVKLLNSLCLGFIKPLREREDIFSAESISLMFSNLEKIWRFQQTFLDALRLAVPSNRIGEVFLEYQSAFMVYSTYCNSYPRALMELENYASNKEANQLLENCRIAENLPELPLSAHLLAPIQRICRYPLHLSELVKHSPTRKELLPTLNLRKCTKSELETMDCKEVFEMALSAMRRVTEMVNEGKRHSEYLSRIQARFENFQGPSINLHSTRLFLQTDAIRMSPNIWNNTYTLFLFDRQLIYCKKDLLKRTNYIYKGRIFLDNCRILNLPDGKMFGVTLKNALRLYCDTRNKWFDFCFRSSSSKLRFLNTLSTERQFCGESLFVSELDGGGSGSCFEDDNLSDREYFPYVDDSRDGLMTGSAGASDGTDPWELSDATGSGGYRPSMASSVCSVGSGHYNTQNHSKESHPKQPMMGPPGAAGGNTLPKKSRKMPKEAVLQQQQAEFGSNSLGRRKLGNWFRKAKSTNSTPSQSPTHHPMAMSLAAISSTANNQSDSSSQSSLVTGLGYQQRTLSTLSNNSTAAATKGKPLLDPSPPPTTAAGSAPQPQAASSS
ncbi:uncharacterized protein LOC131215824 [Anopheles bellator]|uniref:uncharacterized protein LOC131215824 n=1 Tax=Anopheles bellator TaxID=139047 RepID=UPI0026470B2B|nr:uncharacterized protein LOC131215824 [Anopheles bellator]